MRAFHWCFELVLTVLLLASQAGELRSDEAGATSWNANREAIAARLQRAYPDFVAGISGNEVLFADGTTLPFDDGVVGKTPMQWITTPDIQDMFVFPYPAGAPALVPELNFDPGRARNPEFFSKIYGDCHKGEASKHLVRVKWLPKKYGRTVMMTAVNGAAKNLQAVSDELDALPARYNIDLIPIAGTYNCRAVAGIKAVSPHGYGIAIDISLKRTDYWRWHMFTPTSPIKFRNKLPVDLVRIFEKHGFIWGGRWYHYDTMHFEYRPELLPEPAALQSALR